MYAYKCTNCTFQPAQLSLMLKKKSLKGVCIAKEKKRAVVDLISEFLRPQFLVSMTSFDFGT